MGANFQEQFWCGYCESIQPLQTDGAQAWDERWAHIGHHIDQESRTPEDWVHLRIPEEERSMNRQSRGRPVASVTAPLVTEGVDVTSDVAIDLRPRSTTWADGRISGAGLSDFPDAESQRIPDSLALRPPLDSVTMEQEASPQAPDKAKRNVRSIHESPGGRSTKMAKYVVGDPSIISAWTDAVFATGPHAHQWR
jgi:thiol-disulfide isomerase/thioredoxin